MDKYFDTINNFTKKLNLTHYSFQIDEKNFGNMIIDVKSENLWIHFVTERGDAECYCFVALPKNTKWIYTLNEALSLAKKPIKLNAIGALKSIEKYLTVIYDNKNALLEVIGNEAEARFIPPSILKTRIEHYKQPEFWRKL